MKEVTDSLFNGVITLDQFYPSYENLLPLSRFSPSVNIITSPMAYTYTPHTPIVVSSDAELAAVAVSGLGTEKDPYLLEG